jgi:uncharacterized membrane protein YciS (DUF1049 family)
MGRVGARRVSVNRRFWYGAAAALTLLGVVAIILDDNPVTMLVVPLWVLAFWAVTWLGDRTAARGATGERVRGVGLAFGLWVLVFVLMTAGLMLFLPMRSRPPGFGYVFHLIGIVWLLTFAIGFNSDDDRLRAFGRKVANSRVSGLLVLLISAGFLLIVVEFGLRWFAIQSFGASSSILTANYIDVVWGENNSLDMRDNREPVPPDDPDTEVVLVVGDSLVAGFGIDQREDRFADRLDNLLGDDAHVYLAARPGWETQTQFEALREYPVPPDTVIVSYFINDIGDAYADKHGRYHPPDTTNIFVNTLFIPSYLHWQVFRGENTAPDFTALAMADDEVMAAHADELREVIDWTRQQDAEIVYLIWPHPVVMEGHAPLLDLVRGVLDEREVTYVDMGPIMAEYDVQERIVNAFDPHPSVAMNQLAAEALYGVLVGTE